MSSVPDEPFKITGGCACKAVRYEVAVPAIQQRGVVLPAGDSNGQGDIRLPQTVICFCNDCRQHCGNLMLFAMMVPFAWTSFSILRRGPGGRRDDFRADDKLPPTQDLMLDDSQAMDGTYFQMYKSSETVLRCFCSKCGTPMLYMYTGYIPPGGTTGGLDFYLGTVDRERLETLGGIDRSVHGGLGIPWVKEGQEWESLSDSYSQVVQGVVVNDVFGRVRDELVHLTLHVSTYQIPAFQLIPNTYIQSKPLLIYRNAFASPCAGSIASEIESHLQQVRVVTPQWRYGMYPFSHFHSTTHEVLGISHSSALLCFGGEENPGKVEVEVSKGDVIVIPAGVAHRSLRQEPGFEMVGSYPEGKQWDMCYGKEEERERIAGIEKLRWFTRDPVYGDNGPVLDLH